MEASQGTFRWITNLFASCKTDLFLSSAFFCLVWCVKRGKSMIKSGTRDTKYVEKWPQPPSAATLPIYLFIFQGKVRKPTSYDVNWDMTWTKRQRRRKLQECTKASSHKCKSQSPDLQLSPFCFTFCFVDFSIQQKIVYVCVGGGKNQWSHSMAISPLLLQYPLHTLRTFSSQSCQFVCFHLFNESIWICCRGTFEGSIFNK